VSKWNKQVGEAVKADEPLVVLETDKVTVDVPAPAGGSLAQIAHKEGDRVKVGDVLGSIAPTPQQAATPSAPMRSLTPVPSPAAAQAASAPSARPAPVAPPPRPAAAAPAPPPAAPPSASAARGRPAQLAAVSGDGGRVAPLTPVARRVVEENALDPTKIRGSGPSGRILKEDVLQQLD